MIVLADFLKEANRIVVITKSISFDLNFQIRNELIQAAEVLKRDRFRIEGSEVIYNILDLSSSLLSQLPTLLQDFL